ncbi:MAG: FAD-binding oxidoreductase [Nitrososphaerales archaeon]
MGVKEELIAFLGEQGISDTQSEKKVYSHDLAPLPSEVSWLFKSTPDLVVKPKSKEQVSEILKIANKYKIPVTPRGAATWGYGGAVPTKGGILLDLTGLDRILEFDKKNGLIKVECGVVWQNLIDLLADTEWRLPVCPSSSPSSTVGGWAATGGLGYGSLKYGRFVDNVVAATVALPSGEIISIDKRSAPLTLEQAFSSEGILCIFLDLTIRLAPKLESEEPFLAYFYQLQGALNAALRVLELTKPDTLVLRAFGFLKARRDKPIKSIEDAESGAILFGLYTGAKPEVESWMKVFRDIALEYGGNVRPSAEAWEEWNERFYPLRIKKWGPTVLTSDVLIPVRALHNMILYSWRLGKDSGMDVELEAIFTSPEHVLYFPLFLSDERKPMKYLTHTAITKKLIDEAVKHGGRSYGYGIWNSFHLKKSEPERKKEFITLKKQLDPNSILNPGKTIEARSKFGLALPAPLYSLFLDALWMFGKVL